MERLRFRELLKMIEEKKAELKELVDAKEHMEFMMQGGFHKGGKVSGSVLVPPWTSDVEIMGTTVVTKEWLFIRGFEERDSILEFPGTDITIDIYVPILAVEFADSKYVIYEPTIEDVEMLIHIFTKATVVES